MISFVYNVVSQERGCRQDLEHSRSCREVLKIQDLAGKILKIQDLASKILKIQDLAGSIMQRIWTPPSLRNRARSLLSSLLDQFIPGPGYKNRNF